MSTTVVPINPREWQTRLWNDQTLWDGLGAMVLAEMDSRVWNVTDREDEWDQNALLALKFGNADALDSLVNKLEHPDPKDPTVADPYWTKQVGKPIAHGAWEFPMGSILQYPDDAVATAILPRVIVEPEPEPEPVPVVAETAVQWVVPRGRKRRRK